jgi:hypothetical protein
LGRQDGSAADRRNAIHRKFPSAISCGKTSQEAMRDRSNLHRHSQLKLAESDSAANRREQWNEDRILDIADQAASCGKSSRDAARDTWRLRLRESLILC